MEVKQEPVDPFQAMHPTPLEVDLVAEVRQAAGIRAAEALTALRANDHDVGRAIG